MTQVLYIPEYVKTLVVIVASFLSGSTKADKQAHNVQQWPDLSSNVHFGVGCDSCGVNSLLHPFLRCSCFDSVAWWFGIRTHQSLHISSICYALGLCNVGCVVQILMLALPGHINVPPFSFARTFHCTSLTCITIFLLGRITTVTRVQ